VVIRWVGGLLERFPATTFLSSLTTRRRALGLRAGLHPVVVLRQVRRTGSHRFPRRRYASHNLSPP
jgi:hypothetical protein